MDWEDEDWVESERNRDIPSKKRYGGQGKVAPYRNAR